MTLVGTRVVLAGILILMGERYPVISFELASEKGR
jgi:hypothetical protein